MPTVYANSGDGRISSTSNTYYLRARMGNIDGSTTAITGESSSDTIIGWQDPVAKSDPKYTLYRSYYYFDFSSVSGTVASATLSIYGKSHSHVDCRLVKSTAFGGDGGSALAASDWSAITGYISNATMSGNVTDYSNELTTWSTSGYNTFTLNASAINDLNNDSRLIVCLVDSDWDYNLYGTILDGSSTVLHGDERNGGYFAEYTGTSRDPKIDYVLAGANYGNDINGVVSANIGKVNSVTTANIEKIIGV